jgi:hypothetical protein
VVSVVRFYFLSKVESVAQVVPVLLSIRLDKTQSITLMHGNGNRVRETMDPLHHQTKYHHRSCMGMETMDPLHHIQIYQIRIYQDHNMGMDKFPLDRYVIFALWISIYLSFLFSR